MPDLIVPQHDTYPPVVSVLKQNGALIDLATASAVKFIMKGTSILVTGAETKLTVATITASTAAGSSTITSVSSFANVVSGGSITGPGIPADTRVGLFDSSAATINLIDASGNAVTATGTNVGASLQINKGSASYTWAVGDTDTIDTYSVEHQLTWPGGKQTVPNDGAARQTIQIKADLDGS